MYIYFTNTSCKVLKWHGQYGGLHNNLKTQLMTVLVCRFKVDHKPRNELIILRIQQVEEIFLPSFSPSFRKNSGAYLKFLEFRSLSL